MNLWDGQLRTSRNYLHGLIALKESEKIRFIVINRVWGMWCPHNAEWDPVRLSNHSWPHRWCYADTTVLARISVSDIIVKSLAGWTWCHIFTLLLPSAVCQSGFVNGLLIRPKVMVFSKEYKELFARCIQCSSTVSLCKMNMHACVLLNVHMSVYVLHVSLGSS